MIKKKYNPVSIITKIGCRPAYKIKHGFHSFFLVKYIIFCPKMGKNVSDGWVFPLNPYCMLWSLRKRRVF